MKANHLFGVCVLFVSTSCGSTSGVDAGSCSPPVGHFAGAAQAGASCTAATYTVSFDFDSAGKLIDVSASYYPSLINNHSCTTAQAGCAVTVSCTGSTNNGVLNETYALTLDGTRLDGTLAFSGSAAGPNAGTDYACTSLSLQTAK